MPLRLLPLVLFTFFGCILPAQANVIPVVAAGPNANVEIISQVVLNVPDVSGTPIIQNAPATGATVPVTTAGLESVTIGSGVLDSFDFATPVIDNDVFPNAPGIQVLTPTQAIGVNDSNFLAALAQTYTNGDLVNYLRVDGAPVNPTWDVLYNAPINTNDFLIFEERDGNTTFTIDVLDVNGNLIADANTLSFDASSYQWSIGFSNALDPSSAQSQVLGVLDFDLFGTSTPIGGFRIDDTGNADFKLFVGSLAVPEPGAFAVGMLLSLIGVARRRR